MPLRHQADQIPDIDHSSEGARVVWDNGKMDKFDLLHSSVKKGSGASAPYTNNSLTQMYQSNIPDYWTYAQNFVLGDNMFSSLMGPSFPNHLYTIAGQCIKRLGVRCCEPDGQDREQQRRCIQSGSVLQLSNAGR